METSIIKKVGSQWVLYAHDGKVLGKHKTYREAIMQELLIKRKMKER